MIDISVDEQYESWNLSKTLGRKIEMLAQIPVYALYIQWLEGGM